MVFGIDNRVKISSSSTGVGSYVQVVSVYADGYATQSSGVLIGSNDVLTAAHAIYDADHQGYAVDVTVTPSKFGALEPYSNVSANNLFVSSSWIASSSSLGDYGVISLSDAVGFESGWSDYSYVSSPQTLSGTTLISYGYPGDLNSGDWLYRTWGTVDNIYNNYILQFTDDMDTYFGQSGSPVMLGDSVIGIVTSQTSTTNNILSLNSFSYADISAWASLNNTQLLSSPTSLGIEESITGLYVAFFGRAPDEEGLNFWLNEASMLSSQSDVTKSIATLFANESVFASTYSGMDNQTFINAIYTNILGSSGDAAGMGYWSDVLDSGYSRAYVVDDIVSATLEVSLQSQDFAYLSFSEYQDASQRQNTLSNKVEVALYYTQHLGASTNITNYENPQEDSAYIASKEVLQNITDDHSTVDVAITGIQETNVFIA